MKTTIELILMKLRAKFGMQGEHDVNGYRIKDDDEAFESEKFAIFEDGSSEEEAEELLDEHELMKVPKRAAAMRNSEPMQIDESKF